MSGSSRPLKAGGTGPVAGDRLAASGTGAPAITRTQPVRLQRRTPLGTALATLLALVVALGLTVTHKFATPVAGTPNAHSGSVVAGRRSNAGRTGLTGLPASARGPVSRALGADSPAYRVSPIAGGLQAVNGPQRLHVHFNPAGAHVQSNGLQLTFGTPMLAGAHARESLGDVVPSASANRVTYTRAQLSEWYVNGPLGLEQGFTITRPPAHLAGASMTLSMALTGNAHVTLAPGSQSVVFSRAGAPSLRYNDLTATDATGRTLHSWLTLDGRMLALHLDTVGAQYPLTVDPLIALGQQLAGSGEQGPGRFGFSVALSADGDTALVGAPRDNDFAGAVWVFARAGETWAQQAKLTGQEPDGEFGEEPCPEEEPGEEGSGCGFGASVALSADGNTALIGAPRGDEHRGAAWVFTREGSNWSPQDALTEESEASGSDRFGRAVALSSSGDIALIGSPGDNGYHGAVWTFERSGSAWNRVDGKLAASDEAGAGHFGRSLALSSDGKTAVIGAPANGENVGAAWIFGRTGAGASWGPGEELTSTGEIGKGRFGSSVALSGGAETALVGGRTDDGRRGAAWVFGREGIFWSAGKKLTAGEGASESREFGRSVALSGDGKLALIGAPHSVSQHGQAWVLTSSGTTWTAAETLEAPEAGLTGSFGVSAALSSSGASALVGAPQSDERAGTVWATGPGVAPLPTVASVTPTSGPAAGGTPVKIEGSGFLPGASVEIGSSASSVEVLSETEILATTSPTEPGEDEVVVSDSNGTSTGGPRFTYLPPPPPVVTSVTPSSGPTTGGTEVKIEGSGFLSGASVTIGRAASSVKVLSETEIIATTSSALPGEDEVVVTDANGSSSGGPRFTYVEPTGSSNTTTGTTSQTAKSGVLGTTSSALPAPQLIVTANIGAFSGQVLVKLPGSSTFVALSSIKQIPFGTIIDATHGSVTITTILPNGTTQTITLYSGEFMLTQQRNGTVLITLEGGDFSVCPTAQERSHLARTSSTHASGSHVVRKLWANGHGKYTTKGNYASGAVQGTVWLTEDLCDGTLITVTHDSVLVTNLVNHKHVLIKAPHHYLAKAP
jgi:IPT/TIG domain/FG-GAP repeat